ncbi:LruC domain-containing protein [Mucilaginibacter sp.]
MRKLFTYVLFISLTGLISCKKSNSSPAKTNPNKIAPDGFNFATSHDISLNLYLQSPKGEALAGIVVNVYRPSTTASGTAIFTGVTDKNGNISAKISVPTYLSTVIIDPAYIGLLRNATAAINGTNITAIIGGPNVYSGDVIPVPTINSTSSTSSLAVFSVTSGSTTFSYPSPYTSTLDACVNTKATPLTLGVPKYLLKTSDPISATLLSYVNASLPEGKSVATTHPNYLTSTNTSTINITAAADVWITFVSEGAGNLNSFAFYTYPTGTPPQTPADIKTATLIFPNASGLGSGGGLIPGNKVLLGTFSAGTSIGFILLGNAWTGSGVDVTTPKYYSNDALNPETTASLQKHSIVLYDAADNLSLISFEDLNRQTGGSDNDFNDVVFYATSNPVTAISNTGVPPIATPLDSDGDGVPDASDAFPNDPTRAYITYYPSATTYANIAFEDNWPSKGDYDMNDLVLDYRYTLVSNAKNQVVTIQANYKIAAVGASFKNGYGVQLPIPASAVKSVTGQLFKNSYIQLASNGVEAGQTNAVIIPFDNTDELINNPDFSYFVNTETTKDKVVSDSSSVLVTLNSPIAISTFTPSAFNPFLISNGRRGYEIHLPGYVPTNKADPKLFGTADDASIPSQGKYYISTDNWPWALNYSDQITYPIEGVNISLAYPHFTDWASSAGNLFTDWYTNTGADYRNKSDLYLK